MSATLQAQLRLFDPTLPLEKAHTIPNSWYHDPEVYAAECRNVFGNTWQAIGRIDQLAAPGSYFTANLAGEPIVVVRGEDGVIRAFYNVCRHRAACVAPDAEGRVSRFRCRYHGWTYDLSGKLRGTPEFDGVADFDREANGLVAVAVETWGPLVFVHLGKSPPPLAEFLAPLPERSRNLGLDSLRFVERRDYRLQCNWKVFVDNYLDGGYHINTVHPGLAGVINYTEYRTEIFKNSSVQSSPLKPAADASINKVRTGDAAYYWWVFPNLMLNMYQGVVDTNAVFPLGPKECRVVFDFYFTETETLAAKQFNAESMRVGHQIQLEDVGICEEVQRGLASQSFTTGRFSVKREAPGYHFHQLLAVALRLDGMA